MGLILDPTTHRYSVDGQPYTSVTQVQKKLGLTPPYPAEDPKGLKELGTAVHRAVELAVWDRLDDATTSPELLPYVAGFREKKREMNIRPIATELMMYDPLDGIAGMLDLFCWVYEPERFQLAIIDFKRGTAPNVTELQTSAYECLLRKADASGEIPPVKRPDGTRCGLHMGYPIRRFSMKLMEGRAVVREYADDHDVSAWRGAVQLFKWLSHRPKVFEQ